MRAGRTCELVGWKLSWGPYKFVGMPATKDKRILHQNNLVVINVIESHGLLKSKRSRDLVGWKLSWGPYKFVGMPAMKDKAYFINLLVMNVIEPQGLLKLKRLEKEDVGLGGVEVVVGAVQVRGHACHERQSMIRQYNLVVMRVNRDYRHTGSAEVKRRWRGGGCRGGRRGLWAWLGWKRIPFGNRDC
jgi:hypothetical protein